MTVGATGLRANALADEPSIHDVIAVFHRGSRLVDAALSTLSHLKPQIEVLKAPIGRTSASHTKPQTGSTQKLNRALLALGQLLDTATVDGDNLLLTPKGRTLGLPLVVFVLARQSSGTFAAQSIEIDRQAIAFSDGGKRESALAYDRVFQIALRSTTVAGHSSPLNAALDTLYSHTVRAGSRLSIAKARLDLQKTVLGAVARPDIVSAAPGLNTPVDGAGMREMAMETKRLLSCPSLAIAKGNCDKILGLLPEPRKPSS